MTSSTVENDKNPSVGTEQHPQPPPSPPFQGVSNYPPPPQQPPSNVSIYPPPPQQPTSNVSNHPPPPQQQQPASSIPQTAQRHYTVHVVNRGRSQQDRLPLGGLGIGWFLFILGFFFGTIPWYIGFFCLLFSSDPLEKPGYSACATAALVATALIILGVLRESDAWN